MTVFNETVEVAKWIPALALLYIFFLQGLFVLRCPLETP